jgi:uncharacterized HAD superfamily protein
LQDHRLVVFAFLERCDRVAVGEKGVLMKIGLDFDDVLADSQSLKSAIAKELFGVDIPPEECFRPLLAGRLTDEQYEKGKEVFFNGDHQVLPVKDAIHYVKLLMSDGHSLEVVTSRTNAKRLWADEWLRRELQKNVNPIPVTGVGYKEPKTVACAHIDVFVDDDIEKLVPLVGTVQHLFHFVGKYVRHQATPAPIVRVADWHDLYQEIRYEIE